ncbi:hypothetical protein GCM10023201_51510 [Actinomycetospora corticicola]|uniref:Small secreted domain DUF320 n=1 Tax=Actinomycetospora corticicola TaxID=663602 RepID=A0A7Y9J6T6_9PSEU|nr:hypothetical protein [Actinomycetospora corticicola]NYD37585.1 hypothetical protein [Actinomycetospora corticicola]
MKNVIGRAAIAAAVIGVGITSTAGIASAAPSNSCSNSVKAVSKTSVGRTLGDVTGGSQNISVSNSCHNGNGNVIGSRNNTATAGGTIRNGDQTTITRTVTRTTTFDSFFGPGFPFN